MTFVLDASVWVAALSPAERNHVTARALLAGVPEDRPFTVPAVFRIEVIAALARRGEPPELLDLVDALVRGPRFHAAALDARRIERAVDVARSAGLRAYDALYLALALELDAPLLTLDDELERKATRAYPEVRIGL